MTRLATLLRSTLLAAAVPLLSPLACAQSVVERTALPAASATTAEAAGPKVEIDLGETTVLTPRPAAEMPLAARSALEGSKAKSQGSAPARFTGNKAPAARADRAQDGAAGAAVDATRRVEFKRQPIPVSLQIGRERLVTFPGPVLLHVQSGIESLVRLQTIGRTLYATALAPFGPIRIVAEDLERDSRMYPIDLIARQGTVVESDEIEIQGAPLPSTAQAASATAGRGEGVEGPDMVALTRYASLVLYAPVRLVPSNPAVRQVPVTTAPVPGLYRGAQLITTPIAAWRSGNLYVTAVRFTNQGGPLDLAMDDIRGQWLAATAQHNHLGVKGAETDTTAVYLVCDKPFEACR